MNTSRKCPVCGTYHLEPPHARPCYYDRLRQALGDVTPTQEEDRILRWLAGIDATTINPVADLFERCRGVPVGATDARPCRRCGLARNRHAGEHDWQSY